MARSRKKHPSPPPAPPGKPPPSRAAAGTGKDAAAPAGGANPVQPGAAPESNCPLPASRGAGPGDASWLADPSAAPSAIPDSSGDDANHLGRHAGWVGGFTAISRLTGFARDWCLVFIFSQAKWVADAFIFAFALPNMFRNLLGEGALSSSLMPAFVAERENKGAGAAAALASRVLLMLAVVGGIAVAAAIAGLWLFEYIFRPSPSVALTLRLVRWLFPFMPLICLSAVVGSLLQGIKRFNWPAAMPIFLNLGFLGAYGWIYFVFCGGDLSALSGPGPGLGPAGPADPAAMAAPAVNAAIFIAIIVVATGALQAGWLIGRLRAAGIPLRLLKDGLAPGPDAAAGTARVLQAFAPAALGLGVVQINVLTDKIIAQWLSARAPGAQTFLYVGQHLMQLPLAVFATAVATAAFSSFSGHAARGERRQMVSRLGQAERMSLVWTLPSAAGLAVLADPIVRLLFQQPDLAYSHVDVYRMALAASLYAFGLPFFGLQMLYTRWLYAAGDYKGPVRIAMGMVGVNIALNFAFIHAPDFLRLWQPSQNPLGFFQPADLPLWRGGYLEAYGLDASAFPFGAALGESGLALATALTGLLQAILLRRLVKRHAARGEGRQVWGGEAWLTFTRGGRMAAAALVMGLLAHWVANSIPYEPELPMRAMRALIPCASGAIAWVILAFTIPVPEVVEGLAKLFKRRRA